MAISVAYKVPAALLQAERDRERRAFNRQLQLQQNQQNFQREMQDAAYARQLENRQFNADRQDALQKAAWDRQDALREDERQYRADLLKDQYRRQDYLRADEREYAEGQRKQLWDRQDDLRADEREYRKGQLEEQRQYAEDQQRRLWDRQDRLKREQLELDIATQQYAQQQQAFATELQRRMMEQANLEKKFTYTPDARLELDRIDRQIHDLVNARDTLPPDVFNKTLQDLYLQRTDILPIIQKPTMSERLDNELVKKYDSQGNAEYFGIGSDGKWYKLPTDQNLQLKQDTTVKTAADPNFNPELFAKNVEHINKTMYSVSEKGKADKQAEEEAKKKAEEEAKSKNGIKGKVDSELDKALLQKKDIPSWMYR